MAFSVTFSTMDGSPKGIWKWDHYFAVTQLECDWGDANTLASELYDATNCTYPYNDSGATVVDVGIQPMKRVAVNQATETFNSEYPLAYLAKYSKAVLTVKYSTLGPKPVNGKLITERLQGHADFKRLPHGPCWFGVDSDARKFLPAEGLLKIEGGLLYSITFHRLATFPLAASPGVVRPYTVNAGAIAAPVLGMTFEPETLLYLGARVHHAVLLTGSTPYTATFPFRYKSNDGDGWNFVWDQEKGEYRKPKFANGNWNRAYTAIDFSSIFVF